jgi:iron complex outermembrane receptor protein
MNIKSFRSRLMATTFVCAAMIGPAFAQAADDSNVETVVVTGSRIHRAASDTSTATPLATISVQDLTDRGYLQVGDALNTLTSMAPSTPVTPANGASSGSGQQFPNLFNLGAARTLSLVDGRRFVNSGTGLGDNTVDTNMIPTGLLDHIDVVQGGGSVVYGSDGIAGVVNYVLKDHFTGIDLDLQSGITERGDYPQSTARLTAGTDFADGRGNIAMDVEWSKSDPLLQSDRLDLPAVGYTAADSTLLGAPPGVVGLKNSAFWEFNNNGVLFVNPPGTLTPTGYQAAFGGGFLVTGNGQYYGTPGAIPQQFAPNGSGLINYNVGVNPANGETPLNIPFSQGGNGFPYYDLGSLYTGVERANANVIGHYDLTSHIKLITELFYGHVDSTDPYAEVGDNSNTVLNNQPSGAGGIVIKANNPYLPASAQATIVNYLNTTFGGGLGFGWLFGAPIPAFGVLESKSWTNLLPSYAETWDTDTERALFGAEGTFGLDGHEYHWSATGSYGHSDSVNHYDNELQSNFNNSVNTVLNGSNQIVCAINNPVVTDPNCVPLNPFTTSIPTSSLAAIQKYDTGIFGQTQKDTEQDYLATIDGPLTTLPGGDLSGSASYEHRIESANFDPTYDTQMGLGPSGATTVPTKGSYDTNEFAAELLVPVVGNKFTLPGVESLEVHGAYRYVDNSLVGSENVWDVDGRWTIFDWITLRASRSRNFRAPSLLQLFDPSSTSLGAVAVDPCDNRSINLGPGGSANRIANCQAQFAANPGYGPLSAFEDTAQNFDTANITTQGNPNLKNEVAETWTYGGVIQPDFIPGLSFTVDHVMIKLSNALTQALPQNILEACYDSAPSVFAANPLCNGSGWTRASNGQIVTAVSTWLNAASFDYAGDIFDLAYGFDVGDVFASMKNSGHFDLNLQATHNENNSSTILGDSFQNLAGTAADPRWVGRFDAAYSIDAWRVTYELYYLPRTLTQFGDTPANTPNPELASNIEQSVSAQYTFNENWVLRGGVTNFMNTKPSYPSLSYGDVLGRRFFLGINIKY